MLLFHSDVRTFDIDVLLLVGDMPARAKCACINSHAGYYACTQCLFRGVRCPDHQHTLYPWPEFRQCRPSRRSQHHVDSCVEEIRRSNRVVKPYGIQAYSPLSSIMSIPQQLVLDYFHLCYEVHMPLIMKEWLRFLPKESLNRIDQYLCNVAYPHSFNRFPKKFVSFHQWKASEMRVFAVYLALPILVSLGNAFPAVIIAHFSLFFIYLRTLRYYEHRHDVYSMPNFIHCYLEQFASIYTRCSELYSTHALLHLSEQVLAHGCLSSHSMFSTESFLHHLSKLAHGSVALGEQMSFWYTIDRHIHSKKTRYSFDLYEKRIMYEDKFLNHQIHIRFQDIFRTCFLRLFDIAPDESVRYSSRFQSGFIVFHSLCYSNRKSSVSFNVCVWDEFSTRLTCAAEIIFFFRFRNDDFCLCKKFVPCSRSFSSLIAVHRKVPLWCEYLDRYYFFVNKSSFVYEILQCRDIRRKCLLLPFDETFRVCTEIELELEHD